VEPISSPLSPPPPCSVFLFCGGFEKNGPRRIGQQMFGAIRINWGKSSTGVWNFTVCY
jgi:hypothetical protein